MLLRSLPTLAQLPTLLDLVLPVVLTAVDDLALPVAVAAVVDAVDNVASSCRVDSRNEFLLGLG